MIAGVVAIGALAHAAPASAVVIAGDCLLFTFTTTNATGVKLAPGPVTWTITDGATSADCTYLNPTTTTSNGTLSGTLTAVSTDGVYASACAGAALTGSVTFMPAPAPGLGTAEMTAVAVIVGAVLVLVGVDDNDPTWVGGGVFANLGVGASVAACTTETGWTTATWTGAWAFARVAT